MQYCEVSWKEVHHQSRDTLSKRIHLSSCFLILFPHLSGTLKLVLSSCPSPLTWTSFLFHQNLCPLRNSKQEKFKNKCYLSLNVIPNWRIVWAHTEEFNLFFKIIIDIKYIDMEYNRQTMSISVQCIRQWRRTEVECKANPNCNQSVSRDLRSGPICQSGAIPERAILILCAQYEISLAVSSSCFVKFWALVRMWEGFRFHWDPPISGC